MKNMTLAISRYSNIGGSSLLGYLETCPEFSRDPLGLSRKGNTRHTNTDIYFALPRLFPAFMELLVYHINSVDDYMKEEDS